MLPGRCKPELVRRQRYQLAEYSKSYQILELHMDSGVSTAKGGHVIIKEGYNPDQYDTALANFIGSFLPLEEQIR